jgi:DNA-binding LacI/PurR family transcriptional regulator
MLEPPTAVFAASDMHAFGVLQAARELGISVPEDLSVVGYDDIEAASYVQLTTVRQFLYETGKRSAERMLELLAAPAEATQFERLPTELVVRETTGPA